MKKLLLFSTVLLGTTVASRAGVDIRIGVPLPPPPSIVIGHPAPAPVVVRSYPPPVVVASPRYVAPRVCVAPPVVISRPTRVVYAPPHHHYGHGYHHGHHHGHDRH